MQVSGSIWLQNNNRMWSSLSEITSAFPVSASRNTGNVCFLYRTNSRSLQLPISSSPFLNKPIRLLINQNSSHNRSTLIYASSSQKSSYLTTMTQECKIDKEEVRKKLTPLQYHITQEKGTERPFSGCYNKTYDAGTYICIVCEQPLFSSDTKYDSGCGWPAFNDVLDQGKIKLSPDTSGGIFS